MQFLSGVGALGLTPMTPEDVAAMLDAQSAQIARDAARLTGKAKATPYYRVAKLTADTGSQELAQRLIDQQMRERKAAQEASKKKNTTMLVGAVAVLGAAFLLLK